MIVKLLTEHHLEFLSLKGGCRGSSESTLVKMPHCWKSHVLAQLLYLIRRHNLFWGLGETIKMSNDTREEGAEGSPLRVSTPPRGLI